MSDKASENKDNNKPNNNKPKDDLDIDTSIPSPADVNKEMFDGKNKDNDKKKDKKSDDGHSLGITRVKGR